MARIDGKTAIVTGSGNGIGRAMALAFAAAGANVIVSDVLVEDGERTAAAITEAGGSAFFVAADVADAQQAENLVAATVKRFGSIDILANNAGIGGGKVRLHEVEPEDFDRVINVNLRGTFLCSKYAIPYFLAQQSTPRPRMVLSARPTRQRTALQKARSSISPARWRSITGPTEFGSTRSALGTSTPALDAAAPNSLLTSSKPQALSGRRQPACSRSVARASRPKSAR
jgi:NAD(P)-dependent dehydrogenase (short-subunit alcohol dehydrogenase family)